MIEVCPIGCAWLDEWIRYPMSAAMRRIRSAVEALTRPGRENARDTVDGDTPAAAATS